MNTEQIINFVICPYNLFRFGKIPSQALEMIYRVYGDNTKLRTCMFRWLKRFKEWCDEAKDMSSCGKPSASWTEVKVK